MKDRSGNEDILKVNPQSYWIVSTDKTDYPTLKEDMQVDVAIVGGGMAGITTAYLLKQEGVRVAIIEADGILQGTTAHTTAKITSQHGLIYDKIRNKMGKEKAQIHADANESAIRMIHGLIEEKKINCDFQWQPAYVYTQSDEYVQKIYNEAKTASSLGIPAEYLEDIPLPFDVKAAMRFDNQAQFHPRKYLLALAKDIPGDGSYIFENTRAVDIEDEDSPTVITEKGHKVRAKKVIVASHYPFYDKPGLYFASVYPERSYIVAVTIKEQFPKGMYITAEDPGRSLRSQRYGDRDLILVAGEHHKTGHGKSTMFHYNNLRDFAYQTFTVEDVLYRWAAHDCVTMDEVPYIGQLSVTTPNVYVATGFRKWGMTSSTVAAMMLKDIVIKGEHSWSELYNPSRFTPVASTPKFFKENIDVAINFVAGKVIPPEIDEDIKPNEGKVISIDGKRIGAYRDTKGELHLVDTTCTHLGCELTWNDADTSWDCPCHGSRFTYGGDIVEGPAVKPLKKYK
ncbi:FAD-dependent oxidoreductase [Alkaliphilus hydrothermalis]|uniref:Glycine/D-amino acid oxidase-like deaminating enzyme/nitrite reductase/ring-hydroxylating ferredoxin subunit n=1 Tax=Alkaliphilus hydrothermalis TaxID=1482730 RepID=A0ABS2NQ79_9FIRM|nr:FAD-dependent oxidoreductase [Alkaliphilus hydrothermalis]MBM7614957.1 glycine/D-amino acid oxidase-like deaminating enzyme/nitrite reductase/ring-hydroxylating ferredoxin subunit [Alkaliphilus hydrothermalis]